MYLALLSRPLSRNFIWGNICLKEGQGLAGLVGEGSTIYYLDKDSYGGKGVRSENTQNTQYLSRVLIFCQENGIK